MADLRMKVGWAKMVEPKASVVIRAKMGEL